MWDFWIKDDGKSDDEYYDGNKNNHNIRAKGCPESGCDCGEEGCSIIWGSIHGLCKNSKLRNERKGADVILSCDQGDIACEQETRPCEVVKQEELTKKQNELNTCTANINNTEDSEETGESEDSNETKETGDSGETGETDEIRETEETKDQRT